MNFPDNLIRTSIDSLRILKKDSQESNFDMKEVFKYDASRGSQRDYIDANALAWLQRPTRQSKQRSSLRQSFNMTCRGSFNLLKNSGDLYLMDRENLRNDPSLLDCPGGRRGMQEIFSIPKNVQSRRGQVFKTFMEMSNSNCPNSAVKKQPVVRVK